MADTKLSALTAATPAAGDLVYVVQNGNSRRATAQGIANLAPATDLSYNAATRTVSSSTGTDVVLPLATDAAAGLLAAAHQTRLDQLGADDSPSFAGLTITGTAAVSIPHIHGGIAGPSYIHCKSAHGSAMTKGTPVHIVSSVGDTDVVEVIPADAADPTKMPAVGLLDADVAPNGNGHVVVGGELLALSTAGYSQGEAAWVAAGGGLTATRPTTGLAQQVATVGRVHATTGSVTVVPGTALAAAIAAQTATANVVLAGPTAGAAAAPTFRALVAADLPATAVAAGAYGSTSQVGTFTVDAQGRLTAAASVSISISAAAVSGLGSAAAAATTDFATAAQGAKADTAIQPGNAALTDAREWSAETISQAEAEAGSATTRRAFTAQRVFQAIAAWWAASSAAAKLAGIAAGATANATDAQLRDRSTHTGTQAASTLSMSSQRIIGRSSAGSGGGEELSLTGLALTGTTLAPLTDLMIPLSDATGTALTVSTREVIPYLQRTYVLTELPVWSVGTAPTGSALQLDIRVGGTSIYTTLPTIAAGSTNSTSSPGSFSTAFVTGGQTIAAGSSVTFHVTQIGSTTAGAVLRVSIPVRRAS